MTKINSLTGLRFFAALCIVIGHLNAYGLGVLPEWPLGDAVSFFFTLSGFVLTYRHPELTAPGAVRKFITARVARLWPVHIATLLLLYILLNGHPAAYGGTGYDTPVLLLANATLVHAWIPFSYSYFSYNNVSWSISTEMFFYACFPLIVRDLARTWWWTLGLTLFATIALVAICTVLELPSYAKPDWSLTSTALLYINPLARIFEFTLGMCACMALRSFGHRAKFGGLTGTALELSAIALVLLNAFVAMRIGAWTYCVLGASAYEWLSHGGFLCLSFAVLLLTFSLERGAISRAVGSPVGVFLGNISFPIYLLHNVILRGYLAHAELFTGWSNEEKLTAFAVALLAGASALWYLGEALTRELISLLTYRRAEKSIPV
ncbi:acyltransferase [Bradyrhizobium barranii subsp. apii]|uniref:acyltransferase family protein n=1 Tax=Bradyrhizobium barranii TaxID=2992140 RepID=UPI001AA1281B|nr:acyltransferase [Bradyrhizobium barranii]UPT96052.1 acyltransferase [Bradyrhizobium barranii subsp. apii]